MKLLINALLFVAFALGSTTSAEACCLWPFGGWWGAGYGGAPSYGYSGYSGYYSAGYPSWSAPVYTAGYYSAGYASTSNCCAPVCCNSCDGGSCGASSCVGTSSSGSLKPTTDPNFERSSPRTNDEYDRDRARSRSTIDDEEEPLPRRRTRTDEPVSDDFRTNPMDRPGTSGTDADETGTGGSGMFDDSGDSIRNSNKPPMTDPADEAPADSSDPRKDGTTFLDGESTTRHEHRNDTQRLSSLAERSSGLNEVIAPKRLASRSLPATATGSRTSFAGRANDHKTGSKAPVRWISLPSPEGQARL